MGFFNSLRNLKKWFTDKTGITEPNESIKRKHNECGTVSNKRARMDDSLVEVVEISDESLSETEEVEITEPGPSTIPLRASPPVMLFDNRLHQRRLISSVRTIDLTENSDDENIANIGRSYCLSKQPCISKEYRKSNNSIESGFSGLQISSNTSKNLINDSNDKAVAKILKHYVLPKLETSELSTCSSRSPQSISMGQILNRSNLSRKSDKENLDIPELSHHKNNIIKHEMFYDRIIRKFREQQAATILASNAVITQKSPEEIFNEKLAILKKGLEILEPSKKKDVFPNYSQKIAEFIQQEMRGPQNTYIVNGKNIKKSDLATVYQSNAWLNDEVINHYFTLIVDRDPNSIHMFETFFYTKLLSQGYQSVRRWSRKKDIFSYKKMICPIHLGNHWCLICVNFIDKTIKYYDSLGGTNPRCLNLIFDYLKEEHKNKKNEELDCSGWKLMDANNCPKQKNGFDCGVFTCVNAEYLARDAKLDFTQGDMPILRKRLCYEILKNRLCY